VENPSDEEGVEDFTANLNPESQVILKGCKLDAAMKPAVGDTFQFMRQGYYCVDSDSKEGALVFNRTVALKDSFQKKK